MAAVLWLINPFFPAPVEAALLVVGLVMLSGGMHLDGFMDTLDGLLSGRSRERMLEIMHDSRAGALGVTGVVCLLLLKYSLWLGLALDEQVAVLLVVPAISRWGMTLAVFFFPYARTSGLGAIYVKHTGVKELVVATVIAGASAAVFMGLLGIGLLTFCFLLTYLLARTIANKLGGLTGDVYGFINETLEVVLLLAAYPLLLLGGII